MICPFCSCKDTEVKDTRYIHTSNSIRRRRNCSLCLSRFTTYEKIHLRELYVLKRSGALKPFEISKVISSISAAARKRNITQEQITDIANKIHKDLEGFSEVSSKKIGEMILEVLKKLDEVAYIRFASVYKDFRSSEDFISLIRHI